jgi:type III restriction enzyme
VIRLFPFQATASAQIAERFEAYSHDPPITGTQKHSKRIPFYQALEAITGAGKTAILADAVERIHPVLPLQPFVLWLSKGRVVVAQTYANLQPAGKYHNLIDSYSVHLLSEYQPDFASDVARAHLFFATVGTFNQKDKELGKRLIFKSDIDTAELSTWQDLKRREDAQGRRRPLLIVYDEAQNLTNQQTSLLLELEPDAFIVASATMTIPPLLGQVLGDLKDRGWTDNSLITYIPPGEVAASGLIKEELDIGGYQSSMEHTIDEMLTAFHAAEEAVSQERLTFHPKAVYVARTNIIEGNSFQRDNPKRPFGQREAPPIVIWRYLVDQKGIDPSQIAVYCRLDFDRNFPPPDDVVLFRGGDADYENFIAGDYKHIIFNLSLQEGWDDPTCYFAYIDKSMGSVVQVEQLVGRVLRQPDATRFESAILNTAHFYVRVDARNVFETVVKDVRQRIQHDAPEVRITTRGLGLGSGRVEFIPNETRKIPKVYADPSDALAPIAELIETMPDFRFDTGTNVRGEGYRALIQQRIGESDESELQWVTMDHSNPVSARWVFQRAVMKLFPNALEVAGSDEEKLDAKIEVGSKAYKIIEQLAEHVVTAYLRDVRLRQQLHNEYVVGSIMADPAKVTGFKNALHSGYAGLNPFELEFANELDKTGLTWCRNPARTGYGIRLLSLGQTGQFFPDFIIWRGHGVYAVDTTGEHLVRDKLARKLLAVSPNSKSTEDLYVHLLSKGRWNDKAEQTTKDGFTVWGLREDRDLRVSHVRTFADAIEKVTKIG